jgi:A/G-specific adenine glycosylase
VGRKNYRQRKRPPGQPQPVHPGTVSCLLRKARIVSRTLEEYAEHTSRDFPWRRSGLTPFQILLAEVLLQQTRAESAAPVWERLIARYSTPREIQSAPFDQLYGLVAPLGLGTQRVRGLKSMSAFLMENGGTVPDRIDQLLDLPHVGPYIAHAVACFGFDQRVPIVDSNVLRLFGRLYGEAFSNDNREEPRAWSFASISVLAAKSPRTHNWAMLDFTAEICRARKPRCFMCPLRSSCVFGMQNLLS